MPDPVKAATTSSRPAWMLAARARWLGLPYPDESGEPDKLGFA
jgi:hypothetical protein